MLLFLLSTTWSQRFLLLVLEYDPHPVANVDLQCLSLLSSVHPSLSFLTTGRPNGPGGDEVSGSDCFQPQL